MKYHYSFFTAIQIHDTLYYKIYLLMIMLTYCYFDVNVYLCRNYLVMGLVIKKSECKRRVDYLSQIEAELENIVFRKEIRSCRVISRKDIEKKVIKKNLMMKVMVTYASSAAFDPFEDIANPDKSFVTRISRN